MAANRLRPDGAPTMSCAVIGGPISGDLSIQDNFVSSQFGQTKAEANFELVEQATSGQSAVFRNVFGVSEAADGFVEPQARQRPSPLQLLIDGYNQCVLLLGSKSSHCAPWFSGSADDDGGMIGWVGQRVFELLQNTQFQSTVTVSVVEIFNEIIRDLLQPDKENLQLQYTTDEGCIVHGAERRICHDGSEILQCINEARDNRRTETFDSGKAIDSCSIIFEILLNQTVNEDMSDPTVMTSRLLMVQLPITDKWTEQEEALRVREGATLNRSLIAFRRVSLALSRQDSVHHAAFGQSKLTSLLEDTLAGNAFVTSVSFFMQGESKENAALLNVTQSLSRIFHYPITCMGTYIRGLENSFRARVNQQADRQREAEISGDQTKSDYNLLYKKAEALEKDLNESVMECNRAKDDGVKVFKMLELFKKKYNTLVEDKAKQSEKLISSEEENLKITKILLEERLAKGNIEKDYEQDKFRLEAELLRAKTSVTDLEAKLAEQTAIARSQSSNAEEKSQHYDTAREDLKVLQARFEEVSKQLEGEKENHAGTSLQMISFQQQLTEVENERRELSTKEAHQRESIGPLQEQVEQLRRETNRLEAELRDKTVAFDEIKAQQTAMEIQSQQKEVNFEQGKLNHQIGTAAVLRQKDAEMSQLQRTADEDLHRLRVELEKMTRDMRAQESICRKEKRANDRLVLEMKQKDEALKELAAKEAGLKLRLSAATEDFREKLIAARLYDPEATESDQPEVEVTETDRANAGRLAMDQLIQAYKDAQDQAMDENSALSTECRSLREQNRKLYHNLCGLRDYIDEQSLTGAVDPSLMNDQHELEGNTFDHDEEHNIELSRLRNKLDEAEAKGADHQSKALELAEQYSNAAKKVKELEAKLAESVRTDLLEKIEGMQHDLVEHVAHLKDSTPAPNAGALHKELVQLRKENRKLKSAEVIKSAAKSSKLDELKKENQKLRDSIESLRKSGMSMSPQNNRRPSKTQDEVLVHAPWLAQLERERADLLVRTEKLQAELKGYKDYMRREAAKWSFHLNGGAALAPRDADLTN